LGNGDGSFQSARNFSAGSAPQALTMADFNGDGIFDLAVVFNGGIRVLLGNGDGSFQTSPVSYLAGSGPNFVVAEDFNRDGFPDLAVTNRDSNDVSILLNDGVWGGMRPGTGGGIPFAHQQPRTQNAFVPRAAVSNAQLADAAYHEMRPSAPTPQALGPLHALLPLELTGLGNFAALSTGLDEVAALNRIWPATESAVRSKTQSGRQLLDLIFADIMITGIDGSPASDRSTLMG